MARFLVFLSLLAYALAAPAATSVSAIRTSTDGEATRVVFDLSDGVEHTLFTLSKPSRVVVDFKGATGEAGLSAKADAVGLIERVRTGVRDGKDLRVVLDLKGDAQAKSFLLKPEGNNGYRLVVELEARSSKATAAIKTVKGPTRDLIIAIDAGHGGDDPGAIGPRGTYEKDITLSVAQKLARLVEREAGMKPLLIRGGDYYVGLRQRKEKARDQRADMFISLHADSARNSRAHGASVYTLSRRGASTETARLLAERENSADLIGGVSLDDKDDMVATVLLDLSRAATVESSLQLADSILDRLGGVGRIHSAQVEQAGFMVLKSLDMPSVLVEMAYISNPTEEQRLRNEEHQWRVARAVLAGIKDYRDRHMPIAPRLQADGGSMEHVVRAGETLYSIASHYDVTADSLRSVNRIADDSLAVGARLVIPR